MPGPVTDVRAGVLRLPYHQRSGGARLLAPVDAIAEDLCGLVADDVADLDVSAMLISSERRVYMNGTEPPQRRFNVEHAIQNGRELANGQRETVSKRLDFVELTEDWEPRLAGYAPYLDYRALEAGEQRLVEPLVHREWLDRGVEQAGLDYAIRDAVPEHLAEVRDQTEARVALTKDAVHRRLTAEIAYWDQRANELKEQELVGKQPRMNSGRARQRADELEVRMKRRMDELEQEGKLSALPPIVAGGALVVPRGLFERLRGERDREPATYAHETERVERLAVEAVMAAETALGRRPKEMPRNNKGYDIQSRTDGLGELLFIEVKGRVADAQEFTITKNEILTSLNKPDHFILALVRVGDDDGTEVRYLRKPFKGTEEMYFDLTSANYAWDELFERGSEPS